jgi:hypothetical protein
VEFNVPEVMYDALVSSRYNDKSILVSVPTSSVYLRILAATESDVVVSVSVNNALIGTSVNTLELSTLASNSACMLVITAGLSVIAEYVVVVPEADMTLELLIVIFAPAEYVVVVPEADMTLELLIVIFAPAEYVVVVVTIADMTLELLIVIFEPAEYVVLVSVELNIPFDMVKFVPTLIPPKMVGVAIGRVYTDDGIAQDNAPSNPAVSTLPLSLVRVAGT